MNKSYIVPKELIVQVLPNDEAFKECFIINIVENGMSPFFKNGDIILVRKCTELKKGKVYAFEYEDNGKSIYRVCAVFWTDDMDTDKQFLGYHLTGEGIVIDVDKIKSVNEVLLVGKEAKVWSVFGFNNKPVSARSRFLDLPVLIQLFKERYKP